MPTKRQRQKNFRLFFILSFVGGGLFVSYLLYLWWQSEEQMSFVTYKEFGIPVPDRYEIHGIDVSRYQNKINWELVHDMQVSHIRIGFAFMKATEGVENIDPFFKRNWKKAKEAGVTRGAYLFFIPSKNVQAQVRNFTKNVVLERGDLPPVVDIEDTYGQPSAKVKAALMECLVRLEESYGVKPVIYTYVHFYDKYLNDSVFNDYPLWIAHYLQPQNPRIARNWTFWQHSESGHVNGIGAKVDFNVFNGDSISFRSLLVE